MKIKLLKKMIAALCVASMSMSCVAGSVGAIEFVKGAKGVEGVDVEKAQEHIKELNDFIKRIKGKLYEFRDLIELRLGETRPDKMRSNRFREHLKLVNKQNKDKQLWKLKLENGKEEFESKKSFFEKELFSLQNERNQIYRDEIELGRMKKIKI